MINKECQQHFRNAGDCGKGRTDLYFGKYDCNNQMSLMKNKESCKYRALRTMRYNTEMSIEQLQSWKVGIYDNYHKIY